MSRETVFLCLAGLRASRPCSRIRFQRMRWVMGSGACWPSRTVGPVKSGLGFEVEPIRLDPADTGAERVPFVSGVLSRPDHPLPPAPVLGVLAWGC